jgi:eukaryotic-like serine/threonine-protein kinase
LKNQPPPPEKQQGIEAIARRDYQTAYQLLDAAWKKQRDPETLIYRNNAWIEFGASKQPRATLAVAVPLPAPDQSFDTGIEILRGAAQAQEEAIYQHRFNLQVLIADDGNRVDQAQAVAERLVKKPNLLAVVGHYASEITRATLPIYQKHQLVTISASSTSANLSSWGNQPDHVFFRTVNTTQQHALGLFRYLNQAAPGAKVAMFYNHQLDSEFSQSMKEQFTSLLPSSQVLNQPEFDLSDSRFNATKALNKARQQGAKALAVFPDGHTSSNTFQNALNLITANQGELWILGANTLYNFETLKQTGQEASSRLVLDVVWHSMQSANPDYPKAAEQFWGGTVGGRTATAFGRASDYCWKDSEVAPNPRPVG